ncbi:hypothetical protein F2Q69_00036156 [Brassica cretica]|uniref:Uncharacterized protein n=1 Tax=Brassica cretica TaxID=69181 RepID=A0A8S9SUM2_BRACR|nr:hypothetical protein F2Q69_00036156 [Brassica cretica]
MSNTPYHGKEISADTYAALTRHQFNLDLLIADSTKDTKVDCFERTKADLQLLVLGLGIHGIRFFKQVWKIFGASARDDHRDQLSVDIGELEPIDTQDMVSIDSEAGRKPIWSQPT